MQQTRMFLRPFASLLLVLFALVILPLPSAQAAMISSDVALAGNSAAHVQLKQLLARDDVRTQLVEAGVDLTQVEQRVASLTDTEAQQLATQFEELPAGQGVLGVLVFVFLVLLFTDIMGYTDIFPFVKKTAR